MRRPPDTPAPTSHEVASSNSTLNAFLGGKQKSWMTAGASNVRPTPRDPTRSSTSSAVFQRNSVATVLPSPAPSDEPSPVQPQTESPAAEVLAEPMYQAPQQQQLPPQQQPVYHQRQNSGPSPQFQNQENQSPNAVHNAAQLQHQNKRKRTMPPNTNPNMSSIPSLTSRVAMIDEHIRLIGFNNLNTSIERPRFSLLREACGMDDFFYVALHQIFCTWSVNPDTVLAAVPDLPGPETLSIAFKILSQLIRDNTGLTLIHLNWFTQFPAPLQSLVASSDVYRKNLSNVGLFLDRLRTDWSVLTLKCQERGYPPLCDELVTMLNLLSPVLQNVFFTATRRNLNISDDKYGHAMESLFVKDRSDFRNLALRMNTDRPPTDKEMTLRKTKLISDYLKLHQQHQQAQRIPRPIQAVPVQSRQTPTAPPNGTATSQQPSRSNSYTQLPAAQGQYAPQETNPVQNPYASPYASPLLVQAQETRFLPYHPNQATNTVAAPPGYAPTSSAGYGYMPVVPSNTASPIDRNHPPGYFPAAPQYEPQQRQATHQQQQGQWMRDFSQSHEQDQRIRQVLVSQQNHQQNQQNQSQNLQQQQQLLRQQHMMQQRQAHPRVASVSNPGRVNSRQNSVGSPYPNTHLPNVAPVATGGIPRKEDDTFIPPVGAPPPNQPPQPDVTALHQAHVRSPRLLTAGLNSRAPESPEERFYQAISGFVIHPVALPTDMTLSSYEFGISENTWAKVARTLWPGPGELATRNVSGGSLQYRLRCVQLGPDDRVPIKVPSEHDWIIADTKWPETIFFEVNGNALELRRKCHHGKDLPVDITTFVKPPSAKYGDGANQVRVSYPRSRKPGSPTPRYAFAVEVIEVLQHGTIMEMAKKQRIPGSQTLTNIMEKLSVSMDDDDELAMVASDLTIDLADPFTSKIFETPVRGITCLHRECFDLETFLITRHSKPRRPEQPCMVDVWKCPLCSKDARPYSLRVDEFLFFVRTSLAQQNLLDCKAILVSANGSWRPKPEPKPINRNKRNASAAGMDDDDMDDDEETNKTPAPSKGPEPDVIELDSD